MANELILNGYFGVKQSFHVSDPNVTTGWFAGQLFKIDSIGLSGAAALKGATTSKGPFVGLNATSGAMITGVAMENSSDVTTAISGMQQPSGSKVTLLHGHSSFILEYNGTATPSAALGQTAWAAAGIPWEYDVHASGALMDPLFASANGKFCVTTGGMAVSQDSVKHPIGHIWQVPTLANSWQLGVVLYN